MNEYQDELNYIKNHSLGKFELLQELVDRATPKDATKSDVCPSCGGHGYLYPYCPECVQALDWSGNINDE